MSDRMADGQGMQVLPAFFGWRVEQIGCQRTVGYCQPRNSAMRALNLEFSSLALRSRTILVLVDPDRPSPGYERPRASLRR